jgi:nitrite reductase (NADH) small subunit
MGAGGADRTGRGPGVTRVCRSAELELERGAAALVDGDQVALFRLDGDEVLAVDNHDPHSGVNVLSRGIVGSTGEQVYVASPLYKARFDLHTGACLDDPDLAVHVWTVRLADGWVEVER